MSVAVESVQIKKIEIFGFKSFADKTTLNIDRDITAIVGPNGCGKSNVVDAIRWVMGEQSAKHLRGQQMEDIIFNGAKDRKPSAMASVELTFSTEGYQTPPAYQKYSEISISRRLFRSGDSEYRINKTQVRLKDITDLFLGTGIGTKAYSIIEQGRVGQIVQAKAEDRRFIIEEVAGISKFKIRKEAALRKIKQANENLLRLSDVFAELQKQKEKLNKQAQKAKAYQEIKNELSKVQTKLFKAHFFQLATNLNTNTEELKKKKQAKQNTDIALEKSQIEVHTQKNNLFVLEDELKEKQNTLFSQTNQIQLFESFLNNLEKEKNSLEKEQAQIKAQIIEAENQLHSLKEKINDRLDESVKSEFLFHENQWKLDFAKEQADEKTKTKVDELRTTTQSLQKKKLALQIELNQQKSAVFYQQKNQTELSTQLEQIKIEKEQKEQELKSFEKEKKQKASELEKNKQAKLDLSDQTQKLTKLRDDKKNNLGLLQEKLGETSQAITQVSSRLESLEELAKNFEDYQSTTREIMLNKEKISTGIRGTMADFIETEPQYEDALSAVMGHYFEHVVVESQSEACTAIDYLKSHQTGRGSFIPLAGAAKKAYAVRKLTNQSQNESGKVGLLKDFVKIKKYPESLAFYLENIQVFENFDQALAAWQKTEEPQTFVSLSGDIIDERGVISGGGQKKNLVSIFKKRRLIKELKVNLSQLKLSFKEQSFEAEILKKDLTKLDNDLKNHEKSHLNQEMEFVHLTNQNQKLAETIHQFTHQIAKMKSQIDELSQKKSQNKIQLETNKQNIIEIEKNLKTVSKNLDEKEEALRANLSQFEIQTKAVGEAQILLAQTKAEHEKQSYHLNELIKTYDQLEFSLYQYAIKEKVTQHQTKRNLAKQNLVKAVLKAKLKAKETGQTSFEKINQQYQEKREQLKVFEKQLADQNQAQQKLGNQISTLEIKTAKIQTEIENLEAQYFEMSQENFGDYKNYHQFIPQEKELQQEKTKLKSRLASFGAVNLAALDEYEEVKERVEFMALQKEDLAQSLDQLKEVITKIDQTTQQKFEKSFAIVNQTFQKAFERLFLGGKAWLRLTQPDNLLETGIEIVARPPGKKLSSISLLSGGEQALTAVSLIFSVFLVKPSPFCILDEVDAPLDEANVARYNQMIREMTGQAQFIVITHNKKTMQMVDALFGVTMQEPGVSKLISVKMPTDENPPQ